MATQTQVQGGKATTDKVSIELLNEVLSSYVSDYEKDLKSSISKMTGKKSNEIDQGTLMEMQAKVQTWSIIVSAASGAIRAVGDGLKSTVQNIR
jgi:hypothetical protein